MDPIVLVIRHLFLLTDLYKPGDVLHYKGFIKEDTGFTYVLPKYKNVTIQIYAQGYPEGDPIYSKVVSIDDFGVLLETLHYLKILI